MRYELLFSLSLFSASALFAQSTNPQALFQAHCATCHSSGNAIGAPLPENLRQMSWKTILTALETGRMAGIGSGLNGVDRETIAKFLGTNDTQTMPASASCPAKPGGNARAELDSKAPSWNGWADPANTRFQNAKAAGLPTASVPKLKLKWAFGFPGVATALGVPSVFGSRVYVGAADGSVYSIDSQRGCVYWTYSAVAGVRVPPIIGEANTSGVRAAYFGDLKGNVYAVDAVTGAQIWRVRADEHPLAVISGSPKLDAGRLYVPVSGRDESAGATNPKYECCTFRGSVVALDAATGKRVWRTFLVADEPKETGKNAIGAKTFGPSGVAVWSSPTLDLRKRVIYVGTGVNYSNPPTETSDAIVALDMASGKILWSKQFTAGDGYNFACVAQDKTNCPRDPFVDSDLGNSGILRTLKNGNRVLVASDKGGNVIGIDPDEQGRILWRQRPAAGGVNGGFMWGGAGDEQGVAYLGISDFTAGKPEAGGGLIAMQIATGEKLWLTPAPKPTCLGVPGCSAAQPAPVTVIPGVAFLGSWDGHIRAYETNKGAIIWDFNTAQDFATVNGVKAKGGSINSMAPTVAGGVVYVTSGYSGAAMPGNVLLAFSPDGR
jgi:polyvinyl alcohol dehydrogenase (cytochrome)